MSGKQLSSLTQGIAAYSTVNLANLITLRGIMTTPYGMENCLHVGFAS